MRDRPIADGLAPGEVAGLERSCSGDWIARGPGLDGLERIEAWFGGEAYAPHRHDTYALGLTLAGIQSFAYRGSLRHSRPGQAIVLHPDERHDGKAGTRAGLHYRMLYLDPAQLRAAAGLPVLPFVADPVQSDPALAAALRSLLAGIDGTPPPLAIDDAMVRLADALARCAGGRPRRAESLARPGLLRARDCLRADPAVAVSSADLERASGLDRFTLARQFRRAFGTSPHRYLVGRRLALARRLIEAGQPMALAAQAAGFADQSHLTRHFKQAYGMPPGRWLTLMRET